MAGAQGSAPAEEDKDTLPGRMSYLYEKHAVAMEAEPDEPGDLGGLADDDLVANPAAFQVTYFGFTPEAQKAFAYAVDIWAKRLTSPVPVTVFAYYEDMGPGTLGGAMPVSIVRNFPGAPQKHMYYPAALANRFAGNDLNEAPDILVAIGTGVHWYYGTDGRTPARGHV